MDYEVIISEIPLIIYAEGGITGDQIVDLLEQQPTSPTDTRLDASAIKNLPKSEPMEAADIRDALETLTGSDRLPASAIYGIPEAQTATEIRDLLSKLTGDDRLNIEYLSDVVKINIQGVARAFNHRATGNVISTGFQANMTNILPGDLWFVSSVSSNAYNIENGDWIIALIADPSFVYSNAGQWLIMKFSRLNSLAQSILSSNETTSSATENASNGCEATGTASIALGADTQATADTATALGRDSVSERPGGIARASGKITNDGDCQVQHSSMSRTITDATTHVMTDPDDYILDPTKTYYIEVKVVARQTATTGETAKSMCWKYAVLASMSGEGAWDIDVSGGEVLNIGECAAGCEILTTEPYIGKLAIACTGVADVTTVFHASIESVEIGLTTIPE